jgi:hypothetical protein
MEKKNITVSDLYEKLYIIENFIKESEEKIKCSCNYDVLAKKIDSIQVPSSSSKEFESLLNLRLSVERDEMLEKIENQRKDLESWKTFVTEMNTLVRSLQICVEEIKNMNIAHEIEEARRLRQEIESFLKKNKTPLRSRRKNVSPKINDDGKRKV